MSVGATSYKITGWTVDLTGSGVVLQANVMKYVEDDEGEVSGRGSWTASKRYTGAQFANRTGAEQRADLIAAVKSEVRNAAIAAKKIT